MRRWVFACAVVCAVGSAKPSQAARMLFSENWQSGASAWRTTDAAGITLTTDAAICSSTFQRETVLASGGRAFTVSPIPVVGGTTHCLTAWVRGSAGTQPFIGINLSNAAGALGTEHWLMGASGYPNGYGGAVTAVTTDGVWHWLSASFPLEAGATHLLIKNELFVGGAAGSADFDDIRLYDGACPVGPEGAAHVACSGTTPACTTDGRCVECIADATCPTAKPRCSAVNVCVECTSTADCKTAAKPACDLSVGACRACASDAECTTAPNLKCHTAVTPAACVECLTDPDCGAGRACDLATHTCATASADAGSDTAADTAADTATADTGVAADTAVIDAPAEVATDTAVADSAAGDGAVADTAVADTAVADTTVADTTVADTTVPDSMATDSGEADTATADSATVEDSSTTTDTSAVVDSASPDPSAPGETATDGGCGCDVPRSSSPRTALFSIAALALLAMRRRRR